MRSPIYRPLGRFKSFTTSLGLKKTFFHFIRDWRDCVLTQELFGRPCRQNWRRKSQRKSWKASGCGTRLLPKIFWPLQGMVSFVQIQRRQLKIFLKTTTWGSHGESFTESAEMQFRTVFENDRTWSVSWESTLPKPRWIRWTLTTLPSIW